VRPSKPAVVASTAFSPFRLNIIFAIAKKKLLLNPSKEYLLSQWYPTFFGVGAEFQISEYVWSRMKTLK